MEVASPQIAESNEASTTAVKKKSSFFPTLSLRGRVIAQITLLVATIVGVYTFLNIASLTSLLINQRTEQARQLSKQISYAIQQDLVLSDGDPYASMAKSKNSRVRELMESTIVSTHTIMYLYITNEAGQIATDEEGLNALITNAHSVGDLGEQKPNLQDLAKQNLYLQLLRIFGRNAIYEFREPLLIEPAVKGELLLNESSKNGELCIGVSALAIRKELLSPIKQNILIGLLATLAAAIVAGISANLTLRPLAFISSSIAKLEMNDDSDAAFEAKLPRDEMVTGVTSRLKQLGARLAGERSELEIMRGRLRQVIGHLEDRLLLINREGRVILASPDAEEILGLEKVEMTGLPIDEILGGNHPLVLLVEKAFSERRSIPRLTLPATGDLNGKQLLASVQYIEDAGATVGALVSLRDYESFKKFESQWDISKKLADLGRITSGIAHEVKNPLNSMVIHLEILRSKIETGAADPSPQIEILDSEIRRLDRVVQTFLNFTRPVEVRLEPHDLNAIVNQVVALASMEAAERGVTINKELSPGTLMVKGDPDLLKQTLLNVILNGCQAMPEGGPLKISTTKDTNELVKIFVTDRGIGIPREGRDRIFNLYYTTKKGGTGIGLAQAFRAMQLHNGSIRFESEVGVGTTFEITLPAFN
jgi:PAS domain S-box-containing protein